MSTVISLRNIKIKPRSLYEWQYFKNNNGLSNFSCTVSKAFAYHISIWTEKDTVVILPVEIRWHHIETENYIK